MHNQTSSPSTFPECGQDVYWVLSGARLGGSVPPSLFLQQGSWAVPVSIPRHLMQDHEANRGQTQDPSPLAIGSKPKLPATLLPASVSPHGPQGPHGPHLVCHMWVLGIEPCR